MEEELRPAAGPVVRRAETFTFQIPVDLLQEFKQEVRVVIKFPGLIGIPIPDGLLNPALGRSMREFEPMLVPRQFMR